MNPIQNPNPVFSHDAAKYVYQDPDIRMVNPSRMNVKPFKTDPPEDSKESKKTKKEKEDKDQKKEKRGLFGLL